MKLRHTLRIGAAIAGLAVVLVPCVFRVAGFVLAVYTAPQDAHALWGDLKAEVMSGSLLPTMVFGATLFLLSLVRSETWESLLRRHPNDSQSAKSKLRISYKVDLHQVVYSAEHTTYRVSVSHDSETTARGISVRIQSLEPLTNKKANRRYVDRFTNAPLMLKHDRCNPPTQTFDLDPGDEQEIDVLTCFIPQKVIHVCHGINLKFDGPRIDDPGKLIHLREPPDDIPFGKWRITLSCTGNDMVGDTKSFEFRIVRNRLKFEEQR